MLHKTYTGHRKDVEMLNDYFQAFKLMDVIPKKIIEFGVDKGGSLKLWNDLFAPEKIIGYDFNPMKWEEGFPIEVRGFNQRDNESIVKASEECKMIADLIIDDCCHDGYMIAETMALFWSNLRQKGLYIVEDWKANETGQWFMDSAVERANFYACEVFFINTLIVFRK